MMGKRAHERDKLQQVVVVHFTTRTTAVQAVESDRQSA